MKRKSDAVAAHGSKSNSRCRGSSGVVDRTGGLALADKERCLASCPADMAEASESIAVIRSAPRSTTHVCRVPGEIWCSCFMRRDGASFSFGRETGAIREAAAAASKQALTRPIFVNNAVAKSDPVQRFCCRRPDPRSLKLDTGLKRRGVCNRNCCCLFRGYYCYSPSCEKAQWNVEWENHEPAVERVR